MRDFIDDLQAIGLHVFEVDEETDFDALSAAIGLDQGQQPAQDSQDSSDQALHLDQGSDQGVEDDSH